MTEASFRPADAFRALADETRLRLLLILYRIELNVNEIVETMAMGQSRISRHLKILADAGLLRARRDGLWIFYRTQASGEAADFMNAMVPFLSEREPFASDRQRAETIQADRDRQRQRFFDSVAGNWGAMKREIEGQADLDRLIADRLAGQRIVADLGCGDGGLIRLLLEKVERVIGVDSSARMLDEARRRLADARAEAIEFRLGELEHLPMRDGEVDGAVINMALHHLLDPLRGVIEAARVIRPGGMLIVVDLKAHHDETMRTLHRDRHLGFSPPAVAEMIRRTGLNPAPPQKIPLQKGHSAFLICAIK